VNHSAASFLRNTTRCVTRSCNESRRGSRCGRSYSSSSVRFSPSGCSRALQPGPSCFIRSSPCSSALTGRTTIRGSISSPDTSSTRSNRPFRLSAGKPIVQLTFDEHGGASQRAEPAGAPAGIECHLCPRHLREYANTGSQRGRHSTRPDCTDRAGSSGDTGGGGGDCHNIPHTGRSQGTGSKEGRRKRKRRQRAAANRRTWCVDGR
jgi:hypothetical protein